MILTQIIIEKYGKTAYVLFLPYIKHENKLELLSRVPNRRWTLTKWKKIAIQKTFTVKSDLHNIHLYAIMNSEKSKTPFESLSKPKKIKMLRFINIMIRIVWIKLKKKNALTWENIVGNLLQIVIGASKHFVEFVEVFFFHFALRAHLHEFFNNKQKKQNFF